MAQEEKNIPVEQQRLEKEQIEDMGSVYRTRGAHAIHCLTVIGQVEGHVEAPQGQKTTKYTGMVVLASIPLADAGEQPKEKSEFKRRTKRFANDVRRRVGGSSGRKA